MKRFTFLKSLVMLFALCLLGTGAAWAQTEQTVTFDISSYGVNQGTSLSDYPLTIAPITISDEGDGSGNASGFYSGTLRFYEGNVATISANEGATITSITFDYTRDANFSVNPGSYSNGTWTGEAQVVKFTKTDDQIRINRIEVTYLPAAGFVAPPNFFS